ncbi:MAG: hypothetical protein F2774_03990 [Actinobacteria bacterium]|uniref:Unannotated protein n=1 Tax=freshwater metagenome TaxID=449393 RepID=A0A6J7BTW0_9ZZZZ|nr:hypothetical protein [Actinomycetota bacterium]
MALVVKDRVQETTTTSGTGTLTLAGAVAGYQAFSSAIGNGNTTFYTIYDNIAQVWEVGIGTVGAGTLARTTVLSNSSGTTSPISLPGNAAAVFCTYPAEQSVNLDASNNVSALGTIGSGTWQGTTVGVSYGGTGVTASSGANSVMLRDANQNVAVNRLNQSNTSTAAAGSITALTAASSYSQTLTGTGNQTYTMPDATTLTTGVAFVFNNNATGTLTLQDYATGPIGIITTGGAVELVLLNNGTVAGTWDVHGYLPEAVTWGTNALALGTTIITGGTWNGGTITSGYGGTGLTTFAAANNALYSTSSSALAAGTLPVAAGGTGQTSYTDGQLLIGNSTGNTLTKASLTAGTGISITPGNGSISIASTVSGAAITNDTTTATAEYPLFAAATTGSLATVYTSDSNYLYTPSTGELKAKAMNSTNGIQVNSNTVASSYTIAASSNGLSVGPMTISGGVTVTVSTGSTWVVL